MKRLLTMLVVLGLSMTFGFGQVITDFETDIGNWRDPNYSGSTSGILDASSFTVSTEQAYNGSSSGKLELLDDTGTAGGYFVRLNNTRADVVDADAKLGVWVYTAATDVEFRFVIVDNGAGGDGGYEAGPYWTVSAANTWEYFELDLANDTVEGWITGNGEITSTDQVAIESIQLTTTTDADAVLYFDDVQQVVEATNYDVTFSVDMNFQIDSGNFIVGTDVVDVAGSFNGWGATVNLLSDDDADGIYEATIAMEAGTIEYKFRINSNWDTSENIDNRTADITGDTVLPTVWYGNQEPAELTNVEVLIQVDMTVQILAGNFDPVNDLITVRGSHENYGNWGGSVALELDPELANVYTQLAQFDDVPVGSGYEYKFVILPGGDPDSPVWESSPNRSWTATGEEEDLDENGYGEIIEPVYYFADVSPDDIVTQDVTVTFSVNLYSAYDALMDGDTLIDTQTEADDIVSWDEVNGVCINGILGQWWDWGVDETCVGEWAMTPSGNDDYIYTFDYLFTAGQAKVQAYKYGINSLDNEAGFAMNREVTIDDAAATFIAPEDCFGEQNTDENLPFPRSCIPVEEVTIYDIQYNETQGEDCFDSPYMGQIVETHGVITAYDGESKAFVQDGTGAWNGSYMYQPGIELTVGDSVVIETEITEYYGYTELYPVQSISIVGTGTVPVPALITPGTLSGGCSLEGEAYEGVLVTMENVTVVQEANNYGEWLISDGTDTCEVEDTMIDFEPALGTEIVSITGVVEYGYGEYALVPRDTADIVIAVPTFDVTFSVDMSFQETLGNFDPENDIVDVAGSFNGWGATVSLLSDDDSDGIYEGTFPAEAGNIEYKFRINSNWDTSENIDNRTATISEDTVLPTVWYGNQEPVETTNVEVLIQVDMTVQILAGNFDPDNDLITVRGSHENYGNWGGSVALELDPELANVYTQLAQFDNVPEGSGYEYKFVILPDGDPDAPIWESSPNRSWTATGEEEDLDENGYGEIIEPIYYFADVSPDDIVTQDVTVTFTVDVSPAYWVIMGGDTLYDAQTESDGIWDWNDVNGICINGVLGQWWDWGNDLTAVGDWSMTASADWYRYTFEYLFTAGQAKSQTYKYGLNSLDNEAGFAMNREVLIDDAATTFAAPEDCFGSQNTDETIPFPIPCDGTELAELKGIPEEFELGQNYPNPFNPTTKIRFAVAEAGHVSLVVYNALGQTVRTLSNGYQPTGYHTITWDGTDEVGNVVPSGVYIYRLSNGEQSFSKKMLMLK